MMFRILIFLTVISLVAMLERTTAQDIKSLTRKSSLPALTAPDLAAPAKELFHSRSRPTLSPALAIGSYANGCLAGGMKLPINGHTWQVMRLSRNRNWGHPEMIRVIERIAAKMPSVGWRGLLVGDISQPRGGPMFTGHASHQTGLDVDIWFTPMPAHRLSYTERERMAATNIVTDDWTNVKQTIWSSTYIGILKITAEDPEVERVLINPAVKKALCRDVNGDRQWLSKMRPWYGHNDHFHVRIKCPSSSIDCKPQTPIAQDDGCGEDLAWWFTDEARKPKIPPEPKRELRLSDLPPACQQVVGSP